MSDIVERLRTLYKVKCNRCLHFNCDMTTPHEVMAEAADAITKLRVEVALLKTKEWAAQRRELFDRLAEV